MTPQDKFFVAGIVLVSGLMCFGLIGLLSAFVRFISAPHPDDCCCEECEARRERSKIVQCWNGCGPSVGVFNNYPCCAQCLDHYTAISSKRPSANPEVD